MKVPRVSQRHERQRRRVLRAFLEKEDRTAIELSRGHGLSLRVVRGHLRGLQAMNALETSQLQERVEFDDRIFHLTASGRELIVAELGRA